MHQSNYRTTTRYANFGYLNQSALSMIHKHSNFFVSSLQRIFFSLIEQVAKKGNQQIVMLNVTVYFRVTLCLDFKTRPRAKPPI